MRKIIGIDIGGTSIKADLYDENGKSFQEYREVETHIDYANQSNDILDQVCQLVEDYQQKHVIDGVGISSAGVVDSRQGRIAYAGYTIPGYIGVNFVETIGQRFQLPVAVENDVNSAALGETWLGQAKDLSSVVMITVGTGIGGAIVLDGQIVTGHNFTAGEVGYLPIKGQDWQNGASTTALVRLYENKSGKSQQDGRSFFTALEEGDPVAEETLESFLDHLTEGILTISYLLNPEAFIIGGGIFARADLLLPRIKAALVHKVQDERFLPKQLLAASLGNAAGRLGAVKHFLTQYPLQG
ncbi:ROK family protein [Streptococcus danieliae]|uniref:ROK family protein n=1 Tax=Streptococcus danieliae TaxID=747656 RepID=A0A7X3KD77_9STRE|nr:ROK family protein [Streptococcus danieliae]MVX59348.1 ROK family protein [Streptococcus danieliae]